jgi:hypothetical protein
LGHFTSNALSGRHNTSRRIFPDYAFGGTAYVCTEIGSYPKDELDVMDSPHTFDYSGHFIFHRIH